MPPTRLQLAKNEIITFLNQAGNTVFSRQDLRIFLSQNRMVWRIAQSTTMQDFLNFLIKETQLKEITLKAKSYTLPTRFTWGDVSAQLMALSIRKAGYLSHLTALQLHALTTQTSNTVYVNFEQSAKANSADLAQESIDRAFANRQRQTSYVFPYRSSEIAILSGKQTGRLGVMQKQNLTGDIVDVTNVERTLIDATVRPEYSGGVQTVLEAYRLARTTTSVDALLAILKALAYVYPYHQAIGFYFQRAGFDKSIWQQFKQGTFQFDFYLAHAMSHRIYNAEWRLYHPADI